MPDLRISSGARRRSLGSLRPSVLLNMFLEPDEEAPDGYARQSRQGLAVSSSVGTGPIVGLFSKRGVFTDDLFAISGSTLYRDGTSLGSVSGSGASSFAAGPVEVLVTRGGPAYSYNGTNFVNAAFPAGYNVLAVGYLGGYFVGIRENSNRFYWSASQDGRTWDALDFASAESAPDELLDVYVVNDGLWLMGAETTEFWQLTGDDPPFARVEGLLLKKGIIATGCAAELDNTLFWWGHDNMIYRAGQGVPMRVSDNSVEERLEGSAAREVFAFSHEGKAFLCVRADTGTFALDVSLERPVWSEFGSYERTNWRAWNSAVAGEALVFGDDTDGTIWAFDPDNWDDGDHLERRFSASFSLPGGTVVVHRIGIIGNPGNTPLLSGQGSDPAIEIRSSRDNGKTFGGWRSAGLGAQGRYRQRIEIRRWGLFDSQGGYFEFRVTDPVPLRVSRVFANEPSGGRSSGQ